MSSNTFQADSGLFKSAFERSAVSKLLVMPQGNIIWANRAMCQLLGCSRKILMSLPLNEWIDPQNRLKQAILFQQLIDGLIPDYQQNLRLIPRDGQAICAHLQMFAHRDEQQQILYLIAEIQDTSQQNDVSQVQTTEIERLINAEAMAHVGSWDFVFATGLSHWSEESCQILGFRPASNALSQGSCFEFLHPEDRKQAVHLFEDAVKFNLHFNISARIIRKNDEIRYITIDGRIHYNQQRQAVSMGGVLSDTTTTHLQEQMHQETNRLLKIQKQQLNEVALQVSQNIQGPLNLIRALTEKAPQNPTTPT